MSEAHQPLDVVPPSGLKVSMPRDSLNRRLGHTEAAQVRGQPSAEFVPTVLFYTLFSRFSDSDVVPFLISHFAFLRVVGYIRPYPGPPRDARETFLQCTRSRYPDVILRFDSYASLRCP
jgi:hypothetical protein